MRLSDGEVHFELSGPPDGRLCVLVHGITSPAIIWDHTWPALVGAGMRVLRLDLYGRGRSDKPKIRYDLELYVRQLVELLDALDLTGSVDLVGLSMGGAVVIGFADRHPNRVRRLALIAPAGVPRRMPLLARLARVPRVGEIAMRLAGRHITAMGVRRSFRRPSASRELIERVSAQGRDERFLAALLSSIREMPLTELSDAYQRVGRLGRPTLLIWGRLDRIAPFAGNAHVLRLIPHTQFIPLPHSGHSCAYEDPDRVNPVLVAFLRD
ncbi:alpha/beta fold hydrolase [Planctomycetota bacterium]